MSWPSLSHVPCLDQWHSPRSHDPPPGARAEGMEPKKGDTEEAKNKGSIHLSLNMDSILAIGDKDILRRGKTKQRKIGRKY